MRSTFGTDVSLVSEDSIHSVYSFNLFIYLISSPPPESQTLDQHKEDEQIDLNILKLIHHDILPFSSSIPKSFVDSLMKLLNKGSIHSASSNMFDCKYDGGLYVSYGLLKNTPSSPKKRTPLKPPPKYMGFL